MTQSATPAAPPHPAGLRARLVRLSHGVVVAWGWRRAAIAFSAGAVTTLTLAPFDLWPLGFLTFPLTVWLIDGAVGRAGGALAAAAAGWWFGFGYFLAGLYWVGYAFLVDAETFGWLLPVAVLVLPAGLALFTGLGFALARLLWTSGSSRILALAAALTATEWLRGHLLTGFPWNAIGTALTGPLVLAQSAAVVGLWGLTFIAIAVFASPAVLADPASGAGRARRTWMPLALAAATLVVMAGFGVQRLATTPTALVEGVRLRLMQPNLQQDQKFNYAARRTVMQRYLALSDRAAGPDAAGLDRITHLIWPESAFPFFLVREPEALAQIAALLPEGTVLITGAVRPPQTPPGTPITRAYNSVYVIDHDGSVLSVYDKVHLVPFGEYLPFQDTLERLGLMQLTKVQGGFISGDRRRLLTAPRAPAFLPLICYEIIFPGAPGSAGERPDWLLNVTNDAWFGISTGPYQHFQQSRLRAIEEGLPLVRAANNGISGVVDPAGRILRSLPLGAEGVVDSALPKPLPPTLYSRWGNVPAMLALLACFGILLRQRRTSAPQRHEN